MTETQAPALPTSFKELLDLWPNRAGLARQLNTSLPLGTTVEPSLIRVWRTRDSIPEPYWDAMAATAKKCGFKGITYALMASFKRD